MTEEEKRQLALSMFDAEQARLQNRTAAVLDAHNRRINSKLARTEKQHRVFNSLAQNGITWDDLKKAYDEAFKIAHDAMIDLNLSFFYAGTAIAFHEYHPDAEPEDVAEFVKRVYTMPEGYPQSDTIVAACLDATGIDTSIYDKPSDLAHSRAVVTSTHGTRKDRQAVARMKTTGITQKDLDYEAELGNYNGWHSGFNHSVCYAALALTLSPDYSTDEIESFITRVEELRYEEISAADIIERARVEAGVDVSNLAKG